MSPYGYMMSMGALGIQFLLESSTYMHTEEEGWEEEGEEGIGELMFMWERYEPSVKSRG